MNLPVEYAINHFFPATAFDLIYLEAVANALDASATEISIDIDLEAFRKHHKNLCFPHIQNRKH